MQTDLSDYSGNMPGDSGYNLIGAEVKFIGNITGIMVQYHPKHGIVAVNHLNEREVVKFHQARDRFNAEVEIAIANLVQA